MDAVPALTEIPPAQFVIVGDNVRLATYSWGDPEAEPVLCVHGFGSSTRDNWINTGWVRDLLRAGFRVIAVDQRGHGASEKPHDAASYTMPTLVSDLVAVLDTYLVDQVRYLGYSLGGRVGWQLAVDAPEHVERAVLGGIPDGRPLARLKSSRRARSSITASPSRMPPPCATSRSPSGCPVTTCARSWRSPRGCASARPTPTRHLPRSSPC